MTMFVADANVTERPVLPKGPCPVCGSRHYWWRPGFRSWVCYGCAVPADMRLGFESVYVAWSQDEWDEWASRPEGQAEIQVALEAVKRNRVTKTVYDPLGVVGKANAPVETPAAPPAPTPSPTFDKGTSDEPAAAGLTTTPDPRRVGLH